MNLNPSKGFWERPNVIQDHIVITPLLVWNVPYVVPALESVRLDTVSSTLENVGNTCRLIVKAVHEEIMLKGQSKSTSQTGMYLEILNDNLFRCVLFYLDNLLCIFNITPHALYYQFSVVTHTSLSGINLYTM